MKIYEAQLDGTGKSFAIVVSRFNELITSKLLGGALDVLKRHGVDDGDLSVVWVPGAFEIPLFAERLARSAKFCGVVCLGALIRGGTPHFEYIASQASRGIAQVAERTRVPISFGVLTCDTLDQALERAGSKAGNRGAEAAMACLEASNLLAALDQDLGS
jgi:6,7-dimethyl-8-ribityllumazine synthase